MTSWRKLFGRRKPQNQSDVETERTGAAAPERRQQAVDEGATDPAREGAENRPRLETSIRTVLAPELRADGYKGSGRNYRRVVNNILQVLNIQGSRYGGEFAINVAMHPLVLPDKINRPADPKKMGQADCEFVRRSSEEGADQWWAHDDTQASMDHAVRRATDVYVRITRPLMDQMAAPDSPLFTIAPDEAHNARELLRGFEPPLARTALALALARMRHAAGETEAAKAFARIALDDIGPGDKAPGCALRPALRELLAE